MPTLVKDKKGKSRYRAVVEIQGIRRTKLFPDTSQKSYKAALRWEDKTRASLRESLESGEKTPMGSLTLHDWATAYLDDQQARVSAKTFEEKRSAFKLLIAHFGDKNLVKNLGKADALGFLRKQKDERSAHAANKDRKNLATAWNWGKDFLHGMPESHSNPFLAVRKFPTQKSPRYVPPAEDFWAVMDQAQGQDRIMLKTFLHLAARKSEIFGLRKSDVQLEMGRVRLWTKKRQGGEMEGDWLPMTNELKRDLEWWLSNHPYPFSEHVFVQLYDSPSGWHQPGQPFKARRRFMKDLCEKAKVREFGLHAIRHFSAATLYKAGYKVWFIQRILRHKSPRTTETYLESLGFSDMKIEEGVFERPKGKVIEYPKKKVL
jgi:integrase